MNLPDVMTKLYASEINCGVQSFWDGGWEAWIGDEMNGRKAEETAFATLDEAAEFLDRKARELFPDSEYAKNAQEKQT